MLDQSSPVDNTLPGLKAILILMKASLVSQQVLGFPVVDPHHPQEQMT